LTTVAEENWLENNLTQGGKVAKKSFLVQLMVGFSEVIMGIFTLSVALVADGVQSFADAGVSLIVWVGLRIARKNLIRNSILDITALKLWAA
jgi:divalent metal cation (Fe/Co/Zn/Cd) transporter